MNVDLYIEELVLHGFAPSDRYRIATAIEQELVRQITENGLGSGFTQGIEIDNLDGGEFNIAPEARPEMTGINAARQVHRGLKQCPRE